MDVLQGGAKGAARDVVAGQTPAIAVNPCVGARVVCDAATPDEKNGCVMCLQGGGQGGLCVTSWRCQTPGIAVKHALAHVEICV